MFRATAQLHAALAGQVLTASDFRVPRFATLNVKGWTVSEVVPRGKHLLIRVVSPEGRGLTIHSHLKMEGEWHVYRRGEKWRKPAFKARAIVSNDAWDAVGFDLAMVEVLPTRATSRKIS